MKILHVIDSMNPERGGVCQAVRTIINSISSNYQIINEVVSLDSPESLYLKKDNFFIHALGPSSGPWAYSPKLLPWLTNNSVDFDFVIVHGLWLYPGFAIQQILKSKKYSTPKVFIMPHGMLDPYFQRAQNRKLKALRNIIYWKIIESRLINLADGLMFTSKDELLLARIPFKPYSPKLEKVVGLGIEKPPVHTQDMNDAFFKLCPELINKKYFLYLGRIHNKKGVDILVESYYKLISEKKYILAIPKLVIAGPGLDSEFGQIIRKQVSALPALEEHVFFPGMLTGDAKWGAYYNCNVFILPSHQENFGISVVEALACRKCVLISNKINIWREIDSMDAGIINEDSADGTYKSLLEWCSLSDSEIETMGSNSYKCFEQFFMARKTTDQLIKFFLASK